MTRAALPAAVALAATCAANTAPAGPPKPPPMQEIGVVEHLGDAIPEDLEFATSEGERVRIGDYLDGERPLVLVLAYSSCPMLCNLVLRGVAKALADLDLGLGEDFRALTVSIDPDETRDDARKTQDVMLEQAGYPASRRHWPFLIGEKSQIEALARSVGFEYGYDERNDQYAHPAVIFAISPEGMISRYLYGFEYEARDLRLALVEASDGETGSLYDRVLLSCYRFDPTSRQYGLYIAGFLRVGAALAALGLGAAIFALWRKERRRA